MFLNYKYPLLIGGIDVETRICRICGNEKPLTEFHKKSSFFDGINTACKECVNEKNKEYSKKNPRNWKEHYHENSDFYTSSDRNRQKYQKYVKGTKEAEREAKRHGKGYRPLNDYFEGSVCHHLHADREGNEDHDVCIYIPAELHHKYRHSVRTWKGMDEINKAAWEFLEASQGKSLEEYRKLTPEEENQNYETVFKLFRRSKSEEDFKKIYDLINSWDVPNNYKYSLHSYLFSLYYL